MHGQNNIKKERYPFTGHFCVFLKTLIKIPLNKKAVRKKRPSMRVGSIESDEVLTFFLFSY